MKTRKLDKNELNSSKALSVTDKYRSKGLGQELELFDNMFKHSNSTEMEKVDVGKVSKSLGGKFKPAVVDKLSSEQSPGHSQRENLLQYKTLGKNLK